MRGVWIKTAALAVLAGAAANGALAQETDLSADANTTGRVTVAQPTTGRLDTEGDVDWYQVTLRGGQNYRITLDSASTGDDAIDPMVAVIDSTGRRLGSNDDSGGTLNSRLDITPPADGVYYIETRGYADSYAGPYTLNIAERVLPSDAVPGAASTTATIRPNGTVNGAIDFEEDTDWYRVQLRTGRQYVMRLAGAAGENSLRDPVLVLRDAEGQIIGGNDDADGLNSRFEFTPERSGLYYVEARSYTSNESGAYTLSIGQQATANDGISGTASTRGRIAPGETVNGTVDFARDTDWYRVNLVAGQVYRISLTSGEGSGALGDPLVRVLSSSGEQLAMDDDGGEGLNSYLEFSPATNGTHFIQASGYSPSATGSYVLRLLQGDIPGDATTDQELSSDADVQRTERIYPAGDSDWYAINLDANETVRIELNAADNDAISDPLLVVRNPQGEEVARNDDSNGTLNSYLEFTATTAGRYFVEARGYSANATGHYDLVVTPGEVGETADTSEEVTVGQPRIGRLSRLGDVDWYGFPVIEGRSYRVFLFGGEGDAIEDPLLTVFDNTGTQVATDDDGGLGVNARVAFVAPRSGTFYAAASAYGNGEMGAYLLRVTDREVPGDSNTDEALDGAGDSRSSRIDFPGDHDWFVAELQPGSTYRIAVNGAGVARLRDPSVAIFNEGEERIGGDENSGPGLNALAILSPTEGGERIIDVSGANGATGDYTVTITRVGP